MCDPVHYTVAVSTGGMVNITNTTLTNHTVTGLNDNTAYHVNVTANNNAGSSNATSMMTTTNSSGKFDMHLHIHITYRSLGKIRREKIFVGRHVRRKLNT